MSRPRREFLALALGLSALCVVLYGPHAVHGGFLSDSWANRAIYVFGSDPGPLDALGRFLDQPNVAARPLYAVYLVALNGVFGAHMGFWLAWLGVTCVLMSLSVYLLLRKLEFDFLDAATVSALLLIFPAASSLRLWAATVQIPVSVSFAALGFLLALLAFDAKERQRGWLHCASLAMFVLSLLLYEAAFSLVLLSVLLYRLRVPWSRAVPRWAVDVIVLVSALTIAGSFSSDAKEVQGLAGMWDHATAIASQARTLAAMVVMPFGEGGWRPLALAALIPLAAILVFRGLAPEDPARAPLRRWLGVLVAGLVVVALGYLIFVPGIDYYAPLGPGIANRVNAVPGIGWVLALYALITLAAILAFRGLDGAVALRRGVVAVACLLIAVGWVRATSHDADDYTAAFREGERVLAAARTALPKPLPGSTIWTFGQPVEIAPGVPVFGDTWDMTSSVQLTYGDPTITSFVAYPETSFECRRKAIVPGGSPAYPPGNDALSSYGKTYFVETTSGRVERIRNQRECRDAATTFTRSPWLPEVAVAVR